MSSIVLEKEKDVSAVIAEPVHSTAVNPPPAGMEADHVMYASLKRGLSFKVSQGNFLTLTPPLTVQRFELDQAIDTLDAVLTEVENEAG